ncbi:MAG: small basic protein [Candidatus Omnitrophica bacterium]|nr:small basic protein [Candidatus Omnitrophota bacterium]
MSIHSSLRAGGKGKKHRSVLKRYERLRILKDKSLWDDGRSVFGIPKVKMQRVKVKKEKAAPAAEAAGAEGVAAKPAAAAAGSPAKTSEKK